MSTALFFSLISSATVLAAGSQPLLLKPNLNQPAAELNADFNRFPAITANLLAAAGDAIRTAEVQQKISLARASQHELEMRTRQREQQRQFALKFNQLVDAVADFAKVYNQGKGNVWPHREAEKLRKAMRQIQQLEKSLRDDPKPALAPPEIEVEPSHDEILHR